MHLPNKTVPSGTLDGGTSFAKYARKDFVELLFVTAINYMILLGSIRFMKKGLSIVVQSLLTVMIVFSEVMLISAFIRLEMYEQAYGFTYLRVLAYSFMIYLGVVFAFTLVKVSRFFQKQPAYFSQNHRSILLDLRGHGRSSQVQSGHTVANYARDVHALSKPKMNSIKKYTQNRPFLF